MVTKILLLLVLISFAFASEGLDRMCMKNCLNSKNSYACRSLCNTIQLSDAQEETPSAFLWRLYRNALFSFFKRDDPKGFLGMQMVPNEFAASWDTDATSLNYFGNLMSKWGSIYEQTGVSLPLQYEKFLLNLKMLPSQATAQDQSLMNELTTKLYDSENKIQNAMFACLSDYDMLGVYLGMTYPQFEKQNCRDISTYEYQKKIISGQFAALNAKIQGPMSSVFSTLASISQDTQHAWTDFGGLAQFLGGARAGQSRSLEISTKNEFKIDEKRSWFKTKSSGFIFTKTSTEEKHEYRMFSQVFEMRIKAAGFGAINIAPKGDWFQLSHIQNFLNPTNWKNSALSFFGENGSMAMIPKTVYVLYKPAVVLTVTEEEANFFQSHSTSSFSFGPFNLSNKVASMKIEKKSGNNYEVTFNINTDTAQVVAVDNHVF